MTTTIDNSALSKSADMSALVAKTATSVSIYEGSPGFRARFGEIEMTVFYYSRYGAPLAFHINVNCGWQGFENLDELTAHIALLTLAQAAVAGCEAIIRAA